MNPDPRLLAPDDPARDLDVIGIDQKREAFGNAHGRRYVERSTGLGEVSDRTIDRTASKRDLSQF